jgi:hypothetical protein
MKAERIKGGMNLNCLKISQPLMINWAVKELLPAALDA